MNATAEHPKLTLENVRKFAHSKEARDAQIDLCAAEMTALVVRADVDDYEAPLFASYNFTDERTGEKLDKPAELYRAKDDERAKVFYAACDALHRQHGYKVTEGQCPALVAEHKVLLCQQKLLKIASDIFGVDFTQVYGERRKEAIKLFCKMPRD